MPRRRGAATPPAGAVDFPKVDFPNRGAVDFPSRDAIRQFVRDSNGRVGKREISRQFRLGPEHKKALREALRDLAMDGTLAPAGHKRFTAAGKLSDVMVVQVTGTDPDGDPLARPVQWDGDGKPPIIYMDPAGRGQAALAPGQRVLARLRAIGPGKYQGREIKRLAESPGKLLGVIRHGPQGIRLVPTDRRQKAEWVIPAGEDGGAQPGDIVRAEPLPGPAYGLKPARVMDVLGKLGDARSVSLIVIATHDIPQDFSTAAIEQAERAGPTPLGDRTDLREMPLITIDGEDARDFDDAVFAEPDGSGYRLIVAIADVSHYVRPGSALDQAAWLRGNSCYFPDRVVPMLPEALSNGWCSLRPDEDRGCLFVEMRIDSEGRKQSHRFGRGLMRSAARLTYEKVQQAQDANENLHLPIPDLYRAFRALLHARQQRGTLDLDLPERKILLNAEGQVTAIVPRPRLDSHRLIEEFMVLANVCAAEELEKQRQPCMYRVHNPPSDEKLDVLRGFLRGFDINLQPADKIHPRDLDAVLQKVAGTDSARLVNEMVLRSQSQAEYNPENAGHFGLALPRYAHFTSPIRRYADLLVHRALIRGLKLGDGGLDDSELGRFEDTAEHITATERRAALAERDATDRYLSAFMADKVGEIFDGRISGVTRFGLFVTLAESGASGFVPVSSLPDDYWMHDEATQSLTGRRKGISFRLAQTLSVRVKEATPVTGGLVFDVMDALAPRPAGPPRAPFKMMGKAKAGPGAKPGGKPNSKSAKPKDRAGPGKAAKRKRSGRP